MRIRSFSIRARTFVAACGAAFALEARGRADILPPPPRVLELPASPRVLELPAPPTEEDVQSRFLIPGPDKVPVQLESDGPPLLIGSLTSRPASLCTTPCTLHMVPGGTPLQLGGPGRLAGQFVLDVRPGGERVLLHSYSRNRLFYSGIGIAGGSVLTLVGALAFIGSGSDDPRTAGVTDLRVFSGLALGIGVGSLTAGLLTIQRTHTGVKRILPLSFLGQPLVARSLGRRQQPW